MYESDKKFVLVVGIENKIINKQETYKYNPNSNIILWLYTQ